MEPEPRIFYLDRKVDATGTSGTGIVAEGVEFSDGTCALRWLTAISSTAVYTSLDELVAIHGHEGSTVPVDVYGALLKPRPKPKKRRGVSER